MAIEDKDGATPWRTALCVGKQKGNDGTDRVMLIILRDDTLQVASFITADQAEQLATQLLHTASEIRSGLVLPPATPGRIQTAG